MTATASSSAGSRWSGISPGHGWTAIEIQRRLREALHAPQFWAAIFLVAAISIVQDTMESRELRPASGFLRDLPHEFVRDFLFIIPVAYSALKFGTVGALAMAILCTFMVIPNWIFLHSGESVGGVMLQMTVIYVIALLVGTRVERETGARMTAEAALGAANIAVARYRSLFDSTGEGILVINQHSTIVDANVAADALFDAAEGELIDTSLDRALPPQLASALTACIADCCPESIDVLITGPDGEDVWLAPACTTPVGSDDLTQVVLNDVTERRHRQSSLEAYAGLILHAQEDERQRIAQELHDETVQSLVMLCRRLDAAEEAVTRSPATIAGELAEMHDDAEASIESLRALLRGLRPSTLDDLGLVSAVRVLVLEVDARSPLGVELAVRGEPRRLTRTTELALFRVAQEALRNVERHSGAAHATVTLRFREDNVELTVVDDGHGFELSEPLGHLSAQGKLGALGMRERARLVGGTFHINSAAGYGTSVIATVPAAAAAG
ncbi:MAG: PAS domain-containing protein [Dehalococcoidia bacterium]|jgi:signal transduction histidine kinase|nr:PAS domain-containing protein [Dehalococcoidia bacterium]